MNQKTIFFILIVFLLTLSFEEVAAQKQLLQQSGKLSFLRIHDLGTGYGPPSDKIDTEVVIKFIGNDAKAYGFKLRKDKNELTHYGMLDILRDAFTHNYRVTIDYYIEPNKNNGELFRVWITKN